ncbi:MAG: hypothetical protein ABUL52_00875 [Solimonas sp.]
MEHRCPFHWFSRGLCLIVLAAFSRHVCAQRADENVITSAEDAFGTAVSGEAIGLYDATTVRGFSPVAAGNLRIEGLYFDQQADLTIRAQSRYSVHVGTAAQGYIFPAPTGIVDYSLRRSDDKNMLSSVVTYDSNYTKRFEVDGQLTLLDSQLSSAIGASIGRDYLGYGGTDRRKAFGLVPRWRPAKNIEVTAFWGRSHIMDEEAVPIYLPEAGLNVPPPVKRNWYPGPSWALGDRISDNQGVLGLATFGEWTLRAGLFHSLLDTNSSYANLYINVTPGGVGDHLIIADPPQRAASTSGELRVSRGVGEGTVKQLFLASLRWRNVSSLYGGSDYFDGGTTNLNDPFVTAKPAFNFTARSAEHVTQQTVGISYNLHWDKLGDLGLGLQHADYSRHDEQPGMSVAGISTSPWMQNLTLSLNIAPALVAYGSYNRGLEDNGNAPDSAANRLQPLPAIKSRQYDVGLRWMPGSNTTLIVGYFDIVKPYVTADSNNVYRLLGDETHRGVEVSLNSMPAQGLTVILGGVFMNPKIDHVQNANEAIGSLPVGLPRNNVQLNIDYLLPFAKRVSINVSVNKLSDIATTADNHVFTSFPLTVTAGGRYKFKLGNTPCTARVYVTNATNQYFWYFAGAGAFEASNQAITTLSLTADF